MRSTYSHRLLAAHAGASPVFVVPAGFVCVVRCANGFNANALTSQPVQLIDVLSGCTFYQRVLGAQSMDVTEMRVVVPEGATIQAEAGPDCDLLVSGYLLALP